MYDIPISTTISMSSDLSVHINECLQLSVAIAVLRTVTGANDNQKMIIMTTRKILEKRFDEIVKKTDMIQKSILFVDNELIKRESKMAAKE